MDDDDRDLIDEIEDEGFEDRAHAKRALEVTLGALFEHLSHDEARTLARYVPAELRGDLDRRSAEQASSSGRAREERQIVCAALGRRLSDEERDAIASVLPEEIAAELRSTLRSSAPPVENGVGNGRSLATGRPGGRRPVSEARPERAQSESVARTDDPHGDTKLSSARGLTQQREHDALSDYRPRER